MTIQQHRQAVELGGRSGERMGELFGRMGTAEHPRGAVLRAYRLARAALKGNLDRVGLVQDVLMTLEMQVTEAMRAILLAASGHGAEQAGHSLAAYGVPPSYVVAPAMTGLEAVTAVVHAQVVSVQAMVVSGLGDEALILGDASRMGLLTPGPALREGSRWIGLDLIGAYVAAIAVSLGRAGDQDEYLKQWIAAIDQKTTDCCLRAHGQIQPLNKDFHLTGEPRYADYLPQPPGHWWCRSATALVNRRDVEDQLTQQMREAGQTELEARESTGQRVRIWPSHARSRRG